MKKRKTSGLVFSAIMSALGIAFINTVMLWQPYTGGVLLASWKDILWALNLTAMVNFIGYIILLCIRPARVYLIVQFCQMAASIVSIIAFLALFPFNFGAIKLGWIDIVIKVFAWIGLVGGSIGLIVTIVRLATNAQYEDKK